MSSAVIGVVVSGLFTLAVAVYTQRASNRATERKAAQEKAEAGSSARLEERRQLTEEWDRIRGVLRAELDRTRADLTLVEQELRATSGQLAAAVAERDDLRDRVRELELQLARGNGR